MLGVSVLDPTGFEILASPFLDDRFVAASANQAFNVFDATTFVPAVPGRYELHATVLKKHPVDDTVFKVISQGVVQYIDVNQVSEASTDFNATISIILPPQGASYDIDSEVTFRVNGTFENVDIPGNTIVNRSARIEVWIGKAGGLANRYSSAIQIAAKGDTVSWSFEGTFVPDLEGEWEIEAEIRWADTSLISIDPIAYFDDFPIRTFKATAEILPERLFDINAISE